jgi:CARDB
MIVKMIIKKWNFLTLALVFFIATLGISSIPVAASGPTPVAIHTNNMVVGGQFAPGTKGTELDIALNGGAALPGRCVNEAVDIYVNTQYSADIYSYLDYFGTSFPDNVDLLPGATTANTSTKTSINWPAIAYILNNPIAGGTWQDVQQAIWYFSDGDSSGLDNGSNNGHAVNPVITHAYVDAANAYLNAHNNIYIPRTGQLEPEICYVPGDTAYQVIFYTQPVPALPDLVVTSITATADPSDPTWYNVSLTVKNQGDADANATDTSLVINGGEIANPDCPALAAGASADVVVPADQLGQITGTKDTISITVNPSYGVAESDYNNNSASTSYILLSMPGWFLTESRKKCNSNRIAGHCKR